MRLRGFPLIRGNLFLSIINLTISQGKVTLPRKENYKFSGSIIEKKALCLLKSVRFFIVLVKLLNEKSTFSLIMEIPPDLKSSFLPDHGESP